MANPTNVAGMARFGITGKEVLGIQIYKLRDIAKRLGKSHELAKLLWASGIHEARMLAVFIEEVSKVTPSQMNKWAREFESWDDTDQACTSLFDKTKHAWFKVRDWALSPKLFVKRAAFSLIAGLAVHDDKASDKDFIKLLPLIKRASTDDRNYVRKAVNWALRNIGKRNKNLNKEVIKFCNSLIKSKHKSAHWIASDALRELTSNKIQARLKS